MIAKKEYDNENGKNEGEEVVALQTIIHNTTIDWLTFMSIIREEENHMFVLKRKFSKVLFQIKKLKKLSIFLDPSKDWYI